MQSRSFAIIPIWQEFPSVHPTRGIRCLLRTSKGPARHRRPSQDRSLANCHGRLRTGRRRRLGSGRAMTRRRSGEPTAVPTPRIIYTENADRGARIFRIRRRDPLRYGRTGCNVRGAAVRSGLGAARFLIMDRATCLRVLRGGIRRIFRSGSFTFAYSALTHDPNYEALLTLATKFCCWRIHFCRRIQPT